MSAKQHKSEQSEPKLVMSAKQSVKSNELHIKNFQIKDNSPKQSLIDKELIHLLPKRLKSEYVSFELHNVNVALANGIRRSLMSGVPARAMNIAEENIVTDDPYLLSDFIINRIRQIPIDQLTSFGDRFDLEITNKTNQLMDVKTADIKRTKGSGVNPFNHNITICALNPQKSIRLSHIYIDEGYSYQKDGGGYKLACSCTSTPLDQIPYDPYTEEGIRSSVSDPMAHKLSFITNGTIQPKKLILMACQIIIDNLSRLITEIPNIENVQDLYQLVLKEESDTVGNIIIKTISDWKEIKAAVYIANRSERTLKIKIRTDSDAKDILKSAADINIEVLKQIMEKLAGN